MKIITFQKCELPLLPRSPWLKGRSWFWRSQRSPHHCKQVLNVCCLSKIFLNLPLTFCLCVFEDSFRTVKKVLKRPAVWRRWLQTSEPNTNIEVIKYYSRRSWKISPRRTSTAIHLTVFLSLSMLCESADPIVFVDSIVVPRLDLA